MERHGIVTAAPIPTAGLPFEARDELNDRVREIVVSSYIEDLA